MEELFGKPLVDFLIPPVLRCARNGTCPNLSLQEYLMGISGSGEIGIIPYYSSILSALAAMIATYYIVFAGYKMYTAFGDEAKYAAGKKTLLYAVIGFIISISAWVIIHFFTSLLGYKG